MLRKSKLEFIIKTHLEGEILLLFLSPWNSHREASDPGAPAPSPNPGPKEPPSREKNLPDRKVRHHAPAGTVALRPRT